MKKLILYILITLYFLPHSNLHAQIEEDRVKASMLYYICDFILWPENSKSETFNIGILGNEAILMDELKLIAPTKKIHNKNLQIYQELNEQDLHEELHALFVGEEWYDKIAFILSFCREKHILLFTDQMGNSVYSVIDFYKNELDQSINFKVNKQNLILSDLDYEDELLLYGGNLIDVRELYNSTQILLEEESKVVQELNLKILQKDTILERKNNIIKSLAHNIREKINTLDSLSETIDLQDKRLIEQQGEMENQLNIITATNDQINALKREKYQQTIDLNSREKDIRTKTDEANRLDYEIKQNLDKIQDQADTLRSQEEQINTQMRLITLVTTLVLSLFFIGVLLYRNNRVSKRNNTILEEQKEELEATLSQLQNTQDKLIESEKLASIGMLASGVAHEINNPLNYIQGGVYGLETFLHKMNEEDQEDVTMILDGMKTGVSRAAKIVSSLNYFNRSYEKYDQQCNIPYIIDNCLTMLHNKWKHKIEIKKLYQEESIACIGNEGKLHQGILNILTNAVQAIEEIGTINIEVSEKGDKLEICISDTGVGMDADILENATEPFFTTKKPGEGTGLGLSITQQIIADHNGNMTIVSDANQGTKVIILLPK